MKKIVYFIPLFLISCLSPETEPHSIEFNEIKFDEVISYFEANPKINEFDLENVPNELPKTLITKMNDIGFLEYRNLGEYKIFFCGYGVVGKGWGFIYGEFDVDKIDSPLTIIGNDSQLRLTYLEHLKGKWFRFGAG